MAKINLGAALISNVVEMSFAIAMSMEQTTITTEHMLCALIQSNLIRRYFTAKGIEMNMLSVEILEHIQENSHLLKNQMKNPDPNVMEGQLTAEVASIIRTIQDLAKAEKREVDISDMLLTLLNARETHASYFLSKYGITEEMIIQLRKDITATVDIVHNMGGSSESALTQYCQNLNEKAKDKVADPLIGRNKEIFTIAHTLSKRKKCNVLLIGDPGVGKSMIVEGLAQRINDGKVPSSLKGKEIFSLDVGTLISGSKFRGDFEEKVTDILKELATKPNAILFIDEAHQIDTGDGKGQMGLGLASMLMPELSRGTIKVIASTTWEGFRQTFEKNTALMRRFRVTAVDEPSLAETLEILKGTRSTIEEFHKVKINDTALDAAIELTVKYQPDKKLPDKAVDILDSACARKKVLETEGNKVDRASIIREITDMTGITVKSEATSGDAAKFILTLGDRLNNSVFHQNKAVDRVSQCLIISQAGLKNPKKPIGSFLFVGPSGVGKTYLARQLAENLNMHFTKYDMSEFQEKHAVARLIGAPPGYVGFGDGKTGEGQLVNDLLKHPNSVILFDEVEKAHPDTFNVFLSLLDDGEITGTTGKVASAKNCIIIMTSNLGTREGAKAQLGFDTNKTGKSASAKAVNDFFLTEMRGRMTSIVEFVDLDELSYRRIVAERITEIGKMLTSRNLRIVASEALITHILKLNKNSEYGARKIAGTVDDIINYPLSIQLLKGKIKNNSTIHLDWVTDVLVIEAKKIKVAVKESIKIKKEI